MGQKLGLSWNNKLPMCTIDFIMIYEVVNILSVKKYKSLRKLRVGANRYMGMNWSAATIYVK